MRRSFHAAVITCAGLILAGCGGAGTATETVTAVEPVTASATPTPTPTPSATPTPTPTATPSKTKTTKALKPTKTEEPSDTFVMPNVVGENLQEAQDYLQSLGSYLMDQEDATGQGRFQILDRNWYVCSQQPSPGAQVPVETIVTLYVVKNDESCP